MRAMLELRHLEHFAMICEHGSFGRAAEALGITQSALTQSIARLEGTLQCSLFTRGNHGASPTAAGNLLLPRAKQILAEAVLAAEEVRGVTTTDRQRVTVGVSRGVRHDYVPRAIERALKQTPNLFFEVVEGWSPDLFVKLLEGDLDLAVTSPLPQANISLDLHMEPLLQHKEVLVVGASHPLAQQQQVTLADLVEQLWLTSPVANAGRMRYLSRIFQDAGLEPPSRFFSSDAPVLALDMIRSGLVIGHVISELLPAYSNLEVFRTLDVPELTFNRTVFLATRRRSRLRPAAADFYAILNAVAQELMTQPAARQGAAGSA